MLISSRPSLTWLTHLSLTVENKSISFKCPHTACLTVRVLSGSQWNLQSLDCCLLSWLEYRDRLHKTFTLNALLSRILNYPSKITCPLRVMLLTTYQTLSVVRFCGIHTSSVNLRSIYHLKVLKILKSIKMPNLFVFLCLHHSHLHRPSLPSTLHTVSVETWKTFH